MLLIVPLLFSSVLFLIDLRIPCYFSEWLVFSCPVFLLSSILRRKDFISSYSFLHQTAKQENSRGPRTRRGPIYFVSLTDLFLIIFLPCFGLDAHELCPEYLL
jgi:hypothetical protein